ncbi:MAG: hypothetical protein CMH64_04370 [Nanoarchaeota archaeon]|nr:hypothetical protein [Nanoarchaeota archaeon]|tara:strand:+ start:1104 stop:1544 length:441 start_codon:yes stop_codon:yes gene_type:complete
MADIYGFEREKEEPDMVYEDLPLEKVPEMKSTKETEAPKKDAVKLGAKEIENKIGDTNVIEALKKIKDPEIDMDIWTLGLIYDMEVEGSAVEVTMTFTSPMCPFGPQIVDNVKKGITDLGYEEPKVDVVFDPVWEPSEDVKEMLGV